MRVTHRRRAPLALAALLCCASGPVAGGAQPAREIHVTASKYEFTPARIEVVQGEAVRIVIRSKDGKHGFGIKRLDVETEVPRSGRPVALDILPDEPGEFEIACTEWCGRGHKRMKAVLVVTPRPGTR